MSHYRRSIDLNASASSVFAALTTHQGIKGWWTLDCEVGSGPGATVTVRFGKTFKVMHIERADAPREVRWLCVDSYLYVPGLIDRNDEWKGHIISFRLSELAPAATTLDFEHIGLDPTVACYEVCTGGWNQFLASLQEYVETGTGRPYQA